MTLWLLCYKSKLGVSERWLFLNYELPLLLVVPLMLCLHSSCEQMQKDEVFGLQQRAVYAAGIVSLGSSDPKEASLSATCLRPVRVEYWYLVSVPVEGLNAAVLLSRPP